MIFYEIQRKLSQNCHQIVFLNKFYGLCMYMFAYLKKKLNWHVFVNIVNCDTYLYIFITCISFLYCYYMFNVYTLRNIHSCQSHSILELCHAKRGLVTSRNSKTLISLHMCLDKVRTLLIWKANIWSDWCAGQIRTHIHSLPRVDIS